MRKITGAELKQLACENEIALRDIAEYAGMSPTIVYNWCNGNYKWLMKPKTYDRIIVAYKALKKRR